MDSLTAIPVLLQFARSSFGSSYIEEFKHLLDVNFCFLDVWQMLPSKHFEDLNPKPHSFALMSLPSEDVHQGM